MEIKYIFYIFLLLFIISCAKQNANKEIQIDYQSEVSNMKLTSPAFQHNALMASQFTCDGSNINPELIISDVPANAKSLALIVDDPDAVVGVWDHWVVFNMPPSIKRIAQNSQPDGTAGKNSGGKNSYQGPCPPSGTHRYFFKMYALDSVLSLPEGSTKKEVKSAMQSHIISKAELVGLYKRIQ